MTADIKQLSRRWFEEVWNRRRSEVIDELLAPDAVVHGLGDEGPAGSGPAGADDRGRFRLFWEKFCGAFPDLRIEVEDVLADDDRSAVRFSFTGTHHGAHLGAPPSRKPIRMTAMSMMRWRNGQIAEGWNEFDSLNLMRQIDAL